jgi:hypothetical protein
MAERAVALATVALRRDRSLHAAAQHVRTNFRDATGCAAHEAFNCRGAGEVGPPPQTPNRSAYLIGARLPYAHHMRRRLLMLALAILGVPASAHPQSTFPKTDHAPVFERPAEDSTQLGEVNATSMVSLVYRGPGTPAAWQQVEFKPARGGGRAGLDAGRGSLAA